MNNEVMLSLLRSVVMALCGLLVTKGVVSSADAPALQTALMTLVPSLVGAGVAWWSTHSHTVDGKLAGIASMDPAAATAAVKLLPVAAQSAITAAGLPDQVILAKVNAMPDVVQVSVKDKATDGVATAVADPALTKVVTTSEAAKAA